MPSYAVVSGKKVSSITIYHVNNGALYPMEYKYKYDEDGNVIEIDFEAFYNCSNLLIHHHKKTMV